MRVFVIPIEEECLMGHLDLEEYCLSSVRAWNILAILPYLIDFKILNIYEILSCISKTEIIGQKIDEWFTIRQIRQFFPLQYFPTHSILALCLVS